MAGDAWDRHLDHIGRHVGDIYVDDPTGDVVDDMSGYDGTEEFGDEVDDDVWDDVEESEEEYVWTPPERDQNRDWIATDIDTDKMMSDLFRPGTNHVTDGFRGGGKTHHAIAYAEPMVEGAFPSMGRVILMTNIIFIKRVSYDGDEEDQFVMETPPNVFHITSMEQMFRIQTKMMKRYGREGVMFLLILDEAQNFLLADEYQQDTSIAFIKFYGTTRKYNTCIWLLTPSINNLPPRARNFLDSDPAGYVNARWRKNKGQALQYMRTHGIVDVDPREFTQLKLGADAPPVWFRVTSTPWTTAKEDLEIGQYGYDHLANADFGVSIDKDNPFDFDKFMERCSDVPSYKMATVMQSFFDEMDGVGGGSASDPEEDARRERVQQIDRMRRIGLKWKQIAYIMKVPESTCKTWYSKFLMETGGTDPSGADVGAVNPVPKGRHGTYPDDVYGKPKTVSEVPSGDSEFIKEQAGNDVLSETENSTFQRRASRKIDDESTPLSDAPYIYNPREPRNRGVGTIFPTFDPQPVGGRLTPPEGGGDPADADPDEGDAHGDGSPCMEDETTENGDDE